MRHGFSAALAAALFAVVFSTLLTACDGKNGSTGPAGQPVTLVVTPTPGFNPSGSWQTVGAADFSAGGVSWVSLAASNGTLYVAYEGGVSGDTATVMKYNGSSWVTVGNAGFIPGSSTFSGSFVVNNGTPYLAYQDVSNTNKVSVQSFNGSSWSLVGNADFTSNGVEFISLAFNGNNGLPYVAYLDLGNGYKASVMGFNGSTWAQVGNPGFSPVTADFDALAFDNGTPYVAFADENNSSKAMVMAYNGSQWITVGGADFSAGGVNTFGGIFTGPSLAASGYPIQLILNNGAPIVAYEDDADGKKATAMAFNGTGGFWNDLGAEGFSSVEAYDVSMAASNGTPIVAYEDFANSQKATVMTYDGSIWTNLGTPDFSPAVSLLSLALNNGTPAVAFVDSTDKVTVMEYH